jgi:repressor LexA
MKQNGVLMKRIAALLLSAVMLLSSSCASAPVYSDPGEAAYIREAMRYVIHGAGILSGDKVVVRPQPTARDGQIVVARIEDEATVKRLRLKNGEVWLMPENENYDPIDGTNAEILGIVKAVVREY